MTPPRTTCGRQRDRGSLKRGLLPPRPCPGASTLNEPDMPRCPRSTSFDDNVASRSSRAGTMPRPFVREASAESVGNGRRRSSAALRPGRNGRLSSTVPDCDESIRLRGAQATAKDSSQPAFAPSARVMGAHWWRRAIIEIKPATLSGPVYRAIAPLFLVLSSAYAGSVVWNQRPGLMATRKDEPEPGGNGVGEPQSSSSARDRTFGVTKIGVVRSYWTPDRPSHSRRCPLRISGARWQLDSDLRSAQFRTGRGYIQLFFFEGRGQPFGVHSSAPSA